MRVTITITWGRWSYCRTVDGLSAIALGFVLAGLMQAC